MPRNKYSLVNDWNLQVYSILLDVHDLSLDPSHGAWLPVPPIPSWQTMRQTAEAKLNVQMRWAWIQTLCFFLVDLDDVGKQLLGLVQVVAQEEVKEQGWKGKKMKSEKCLPKAALHSRSFSASEIKSISRIHVDDDDDDAVVLRIPSAIALRTHATKGKSGTEPLRSGMVMMMKVKSSRWLVINIKLLKERGNSPGTVNYFREILEKQISYQGC